MGKKGLVGNSGSFDIKPDIKPRKAMLIGKTGAGKSTLTNILIKGNLDPPLLAEVGSGPRGSTTDCVTLTDNERNGWTVVDTVGLGEPNTGRIPDQEAKARLSAFLRNLREPCSHLIFVKEARRLDYLDEIMWKTFVELFKGAERNFVVLLTKPDNDDPEQWLADNYEILLQEFPECNPKHFLCVNFPPPDDEFGDLGREIMEEERQKLVGFLDSLNLEIAEPDIAKMGEVQLQQKAEQLIKYIADLVKSFLNRPPVRLITLGCILFVNITDLVANLTALT